ncbi:MAG: hypothetical protein EPN72_10700 [Nevskiaceae bacterium]|nr:MAG: hypothetical protein EPN63_05710 [Nevskiaceae bacterium]TBR72218.1 MAG: hypothetical protein EPN72_10700 [Nevskiaceae bacterium]
MKVSNRFPLLGERLCLDLVNTCRLRDGESVDLLEDRPALAEWLDAQASRIRWSGPPVDEDLATLKATRAAITPLLRAAAHHTRPATPDVENFNRLLAQPAPALQLEWSASAAPHSTVAARHQSAVLQHRILVDALGLLAGSDCTRLRQCAHPGCILLFVATHPRRRWCRTDTCGNRARVARHYRTHKAPS